MLIGPRRHRYPAIRRTIALDNFPRAYGSDKRFGIVSVDWEIQKRIPNGPLWPNRSAQARGWPVSLPYGLASHRPDRTAHGGRFAIGYDWTSYPMISRRPRYPRTAADG
jgi:hypothetical protein